jgi:hypothetical protein
MRTIVLVALLTTVAACGHSTAPRFTADDLPRILLHPDEAPAGTRASTLGGPSDVDEFARDDTERRALIADGFVAGYVVYFPPESYFHHQPHAETDVAYQAIGGVFEDTRGAGASLRRYVEDLETRQMTDVVETPQNGLGEQSFALAGRAASDGSPLRVHAWRDGNLILVLIASGPVAAETALDLARTMDERTR